MVEFSGDQLSVKRFLRVHAGKFYVYVLSRPDGRPFYVGKGMNGRAFEHEAEARRNHPVGESNPFKCNVIRKIIRDGAAVLYEIDSVYEQDQQALCLEREAVLISKYKRLHEGGVLTNLAGGLGSMSGAAPFSLDRHAATLSGEPENNPDRAILNRLLQGIGPVSSVPVKPVRQMSRVLPTEPHPNPRTPSLRCAYALIASASATGSRLLPETSVPRAFTYQGVDAIIENGVSRDLIKAGMASLVRSNNPHTESFRLSESQIDLLVGLYGKEGLVERGLL
ncbi:hypothetical protein ACVILK_002866 [Bradyrhizobium embrapense]